MICQTSFKVEKIISSLEQELSSGWIVNARVSSANPGLRTDTTFNGVQAAVSSPSLAA